MRTLVAILVAALAATAANAAPINPSFETGIFSGWTTSGAPAVGGTTFGFAPTNGSFQAVLQTEVGTQSNAATLATFLGVTTAQLDALTSGGSVTEGSAVKQTFTQGSGSFTIAFGVVNKGDTNVNSALLFDNLQIAPNGTLSFNWNFLTDELDQSATFNDYAFVAFNGQLFLLRDKLTGPFNTGPTGFDGNTGTQTFSQLFPALATPEPISIAVFGGLIVGGAGIAFRRRMTAKAVA